ncbi:aminotransferase class I/II-fold pyridoxal phosphate-dependent enzyme [Myxococcota bacterium]|nr:aminotransferase class I/II-fold pyridoxal phosphate-dependent enzyme [Myxococcota bacterium]
MSYPRVHARVTTRAKANIELATDRVSYDVVNLSAGGALLVGKGSILVGEELGIELVISGGAPLEVRGRVHRRELLPDGRLGFGVEFVDRSPDAEARVTRAVTDAYKSMGARILGQVRMELQRQGVTDVAAVAEELEKVREEQARAHLFASDLYTEHGSDTEASIVSGVTGEGRDCIVWSLNLYLGLNREPRVIEQTRAAVAKFGTGCGTSAPSGGLSALHDRIARRVAAMVGKPRAILFSTGYAANLGALSALPGPKDLLLLDREAHASMVDGARLSGKKWITFKHNDVADLEEKLQKFAPLHENVFVVVESAYSMSGDLAPLREIAALKSRYRFFLYVDEAHTFGFYGDRGRGYCQAVGVSEHVDFVMSTFSKSTASIGGFIAAESKYCTLLQATATPYIFQACLTPPDAATILAALDEIERNPAHAERLHANNLYMRSKLLREGFDLGASQSPVIPVYVLELEKLYQLCGRLYLDGIFTVPIVYPAVGTNEGRIRFIVNAHHTRAQIDRTVARLAAHARALEILPAN